MPTTTRPSRLPRRVGLAEAPLDDVAGHDPRTDAESTDHDEGEPRAGAAQRDQEGERSGREVGRDHSPGGSQTPRHGAAGGRTDESADAHAGDEQAHGPGAGTDLADEEHDEDRLVAGQREIAEGAVAGEHPEVGIGGEEAAAPRPTCCRSPPPGSPRVPPVPACGCAAGTRRTPRNSPRRPADPRRLPRPASPAPQDRGRPPGWRLRCPAAWRSPRGCDPRRGCPAGTPGRRSGRTRRRYRAAVRHPADAGTSDRLPGRRRGRSAAAPARRRRRPASAGVVAGGPPRRLPAARSRARAASRPRSAAPPGTC